MKGFEIDVTIKGYEANVAVIGFKANIMTRGSRSNISTSTISTFVMGIKMGLNSKFFKITRESMVELGNKKFKKDEQANTQKKENKKHFEVWTLELRICSIPT
jgi:hypothetical protein